MKTFREQVCMAGVDVVFEIALDEAGQDKMVKAGIASEAYRGVGSAAFKGVEKRDSLTFDDAKARLCGAFEAKGFKVISAEPYVAPERESEMKTANKLYDDFVKRGIVAEKAKLVGCAADASREEFVKAIHAYKQSIDKMLRG